MGSLIEEIVENTMRLLFGLAKAVFKVLFWIVKTVSHKLTASKPVTPPANMPQQNHNAQQAPGGGKERTDQSNDEQMDQLAEMKAKRLREKKPEYLEGKQTFLSTPNQFRGGLYALGVTAERAEMFEDFVNFAEERIRENPVSVPLLIGAAQAYIYGESSEKLEVQDEATRAKTVRYLELAMGHIETAIAEDPTNPDGLCAAGLVCAKLGDRDGVEDTLARLIRAEQARPWSEQERKISNSIEGSIWETRTQQLQAILGVMDGPDSFKRFIDSNS